MEPVFKNIQQNIIKLLDNAKEEITIVVPWFTDFILFQKILTSVQRGIKVQVILEKDTINENSKIDHNLLAALNGELYWHKSPLRSGILHDKFCIIDKKVLVTGSYNWTYSAANLNKENIIIIQDESVISEYNKKFIELIQSKDCSKHVISEKEISKYEKIFSFDKSISLVRDSYKEQEDKSIIPYKFWDSGWKYRDDHGSDVFDTIFEEAHSFYFGIAKVKVGLKWGIIDKKGDFITDPIYEEIGNFFLADFYSILDIQKYPYIIWAKARRDGKEGYLTKEGKEIVPCLFDKVDYCFIPDDQVRGYYISHKSINSDTSYLTPVENAILALRGFFNIINWPEIALKD